MTDWQITWVSVSLVSATLGVLFWREYRPHAIQYAFVALSIFAPIFGPAFVVGLTDNGIYCWLYLNIPIIGLVLWAQAAYVDYQEQTLPVQLKELRQFVAVGETGCTTTLHDMYRMERILFDKGWLELASSRLDYASQLRITKEGLAVVAANEGQ